MTGRNGGCARVGRPLIVRGEIHTDLVHGSDLPPRSTDTTGVGSGAGVWRPVELLERDGAVHSDTGMASVRIIPAFDPLEYSVREFFPAFPGPGVEQL